MTKHKQQLHAHITYIIHLIIKNLLFHKNLLAGTITVADDIET